LIKAGSGGEAVYRKYSEIANNFPYEFIRIEIVNDQKKMGRGPLRKAENELILVSPKISEKYQLIR
jgi:hypothetical protein